MDGFGVGVFLFCFFFPSIELFCLHEGGHYFSRINSLGLCDQKLYMAQMHTFIKLKLLCILKGFVQAIRKLHSKGVNLQDLYNIKVGNGKNVKFCMDLAWKCST